VRLVFSDDHKGLKRAAAAVLLGAAWQRCRTHFARNLLTRVPRSAQPLLPTLVRSIFAQPSAEEVWAQHGRVVEQLQERFTDAATLLSDAAKDIPQGPHSLAECALPLLELGDIDFPPRKPLFEKVERPGLPLSGRPTEQMMP
jgi:hypothetical protein